ncbi:MAG TPA: IPTL-CTERM sorting domain-containing protein, partial [Thermoanaerobaculia bacterium]|nr:IPTL-CTERM sorting domain-containing protein [Thermoanaerobaculia bacterium]
ATVGTNTVTWNGAIPAGGSVTVTIQATVNAGTAQGTTVSNQAAFSYDSDGNGTNDASGVSDDPAVRGTGDPTSFTVGQASVIDVPTLDEAGLLLLALLLAMGGAVMLRRRRA